MFNLFFNTLKRSFLTTFIIILIINVASAQVMSSSNYGIRSDSINVGGGFSSSSNYNEQDTVGEVGNDVSSSTNYSLKAGYQQMQEVYISLSSVTTVNMAPSLGGITGGMATGSSMAVVTTDDPAGYQLLYSAQNSPAMQSGVNTISDYAPSGGVPDFLFATTSGKAQFSFSPEGSDIALRYKDNGSICGVGSSDTTDRCWDGLSTSTRIISQGANANHPLGASTNIKFRLNIGTGAVVQNGLYTATTTLTALAL
jgi:hypothetical protein